MDLQSLRQSGVVRASKADVGATRERVRRARLWRILLILGPLTFWLWYRLAAANPVGLPRLTPKVLGFLPILILIVMLGVALMLPLVAAGRSPHVLFRPSDIDVSLDDVKGLPIVVDEVVKTLNLFLGHKTFKELMGGTPRRAILFEGPPGTGKTYLAKAMAREAGVPFLFVSSSAFQSMYYGQTNRKIRSYFKALRSAARREGGAIGFIEEIDAIGASRGGMGDTNHHGRHLRGRQRTADPAPVVRPAAHLHPAGRLVRGAAQPTAARPPAAPPGQAPDGQHPGRRRHQPGGRPRPGAASGPVASTGPSTSTCRPGPGAGRSSTTTWAARPTTPSSTTPTPGTPWPP